MISRLLHGGFVLLCLFLINSLECHAQTARVYIVPGSNPDVKGTLDIFRGFRLTRIRGLISGLKPGAYILNIHEFGGVENKCRAAKGGFTHSQGAEIVMKIEADAQGFALVDISNWNLPSHVYEPTDILGEVIVIDNVELGNRPGCGLILNVPLDELGIPLDSPFKHKVPLRAVAKIVQGTSTVSGRIEFRETLDGVHITGIVRGLTPGKHGIHISESGDVSSHCQWTGFHFNPTECQHSQSAVVLNWKRHSRRYSTSDSLCST